MKIRTDFVTNSSSSSFIIATNDAIPKGYASTAIRKITEETLLQIIQETSDYDWTPICYEHSDEEIQKLGDFTDEQMKLLRLINCHNLDRYLDLKKQIEESTTPLYYILVDRDWVYSQPALHKFISNAELIEENWDL